MSPPVRTALCLVIFLAACGARIGGDDGPDQARPDASLTRSPDAAVQQQQPDAAPATIADNACGVASTLGELGMLTGYAGSQTQSTTTTQRVSWVGSPTPATATTATPDLVEIDLYDGYGAFNGTAAHTGTFTISGAETDFDTCGVCVLLLANISNNTPAKWMLATSGTVTVTSVGTATGQTTQATVSNASFVEITQLSDQTYQNVAGSTCTSPISHVDVRGTL
jgi:hypothetical protein